MWKGIESAPKIPGKPPGVAPEIIVVSNGRRYVAVWDMGAFWSDFDLDGLEPGRMWPGQLTQATHWCRVPKSVRKMLRNHGLIYEVFKDAIPEFPGVLV